MDNGCWIWCWKSTRPQVCLVFGLRLWHHQASFPSSIRWLAPTCPIRGKQASSPKWCSRHKLHTSWSLHIHASNIYIYIYIYICDTDRRESDLHGSPRGHRIHDRPEPCTFVAVAAYMVHNLHPVWIFGSPLKRRKITTTTTKSNAPKQIGWYAQVYPPERQAYLLSCRHGDPAATDFHFLSWFSVQYNCQQLRCPWTEVGCSSPAVCGGHRYRIDKKHTHLEALHLQGRINLDKLEWSNLCNGKMLADVITGVQKKSTFWDSEQSNSVLTFGNGRILSAPPRFNWWRKDSIPA